MVVIFQMLVPILIICQLPFLPESPRWYIQHGDRIEDARQALTRVRDSEQEVEDEVLAIREAIVFEKEVISSSYMALWKVRVPQRRNHSASSRGITELTLHRMPRSESDSC